MPPTIVTPFSEEIAVSNQGLLQRIGPSGGQPDPQMFKEGQDILNEYIRMRAREDGFMRRIIPEQQITDADLTRMPHTDKPVVVIDKEPDSPGAYSVPFGTAPRGRYIWGPRAMVVFDRLETYRFQKDVAELHTYNMDLRQIISDNSLKDLLGEEDGKCVETIDSMLLGPNTPIPEVGGVPLWVTIPGGVTRETLAESMKVMPRTQNRLSPATILINNITIWDIVKWGRDEIGGDIAEDLIQNGFAERTFMGCRWLITIKRDLVPDNTIYMFAPPKWLGVFLIYEDTTMWMKREAFMLEWFAYESIGVLFGNVAALAKVQFT